MERLLILAITNLLPLFGVLLTGALLGIGLPVFAGLKGGIAVLFGPKGGYILGFIPAAFAVGWLLEKGWYKNPVLTITAFALGNVTIYAFGLPFLPGDLLKTNLRVIPLKI